MAHKKRGISIYLAADARDRQEHDLFQLTEEQLAPLRETLDTFALGGETTELVRDVAGFSLLHIWWKPNFPLPRHSHNGDCLYYVISGSLIMGNRTLRAGDSFFVPTNAPYQYSVGPEGAELLEVRHGVDHVDMTWSDPEGYKKTATDALEDNREIWVNATVSPTFAANAGS